MRPMAVNVPIAMAMSLLVAFTITPWMAYYLLRPLYGKGEHEGEAKPGLLSRFYTRHGRRSSSTTAGCAGSCSSWSSRWSVGAGLLALVGIPLKMLPYDNKSEFQIVLDLPEGATLERTDATVRDFEHYLATVPEVTNYQSYVGASSPIDFNGLVRHYNLRAGPNLADIRVNLLAQARARPAEPRPDAAAAQRPGGHRPASRRAHQARRDAARSARARDARGRGARFARAVLGGPRRGRRATSSGGSPAWSRSSTPTSWSRRSPRGSTSCSTRRRPRCTASRPPTSCARCGSRSTGDQPATVHEPGERQPLRLRLVLSRAERSGPEELARLRVKGRTGVLVPLAEIGRFEERSDDLHDHAQGPRAHGLRARRRDRPAAGRRRVRDRGRRRRDPAARRGDEPSGAAKASGRSRSTCSATSGSPSSAP